MPTSIEVDKELSLCALHGLIHFKTTLLDQSDGQYHDVSSRTVSQATQ